MYISCQDIKEKYLAIAVDGERIFCNPMWVLKRCRGGRPCGGVAESATSEELFGYDTIFAGFPIWWYVASTIINTFLESYHLTGKTVIPFATAGGIGIGKTNEHLVGYCPALKRRTNRAKRLYSPKIHETLLSRRLACAIMYVKFILHTLLR